MRLEDKGLHLYLLEITGNSLWFEHRDEKIDESVLEELVTIDEKINKVEESLEHCCNDTGIDILKINEIRKSLK